ncbi:hypothetical protein ONZ45_g10173 [Pleurotus djamor]|nr:hypothetical protein ONZ45_g10173 [Pleurotus djamor]
MNVAPRLSQPVVIGDILVSMPSGLLRVAANAITGRVYSSDMTVLFLLAHRFTPDEGGLHAITFSVTSVSQDGAESQPRMVSRSELSAASVVALQSYARDNAVMLFNALGSSPAFYIVGSFERHDRVFSRVGGIVVRRELQAGATGATGPPSCQLTIGPSAFSHR